MGKKPLPPPDDVVLRHKETIVFKNPNTGVFQASRDPRNVYYHAWKTCVAAHFSDFKRSGMNSLASTFSTLLQYNYKWNSVGRWTFNLMSVLLQIIVIVIIDFLLWFQLSGHARFRLNAVGQRSVLL